MKTITANIIAELPIAVRIVDGDIEFSLVVDGQRQRPISDVYITQSDDEIVDQVVYDFKLVAGYLVQRESISAVLRQVRLALQSGVSESMQQVINRTPL